MMMNMTTAVKGSFCSVVRCQPLLCRRLTPSRPHLHWAGQHTQLLTLHWTICTECSGWKYLNQYAQQCTVYNRICTAPKYSHHNYALHIEYNPKDGETWKRGIHESVMDSPQLKWNVLTVHIWGRLYKLFTISEQCGSKTCSALADSFKLFQCSWWMEVPTLLRHSSFIIRIILQPPYSLSP